MTNQDRAEIPEDIQQAYRDLGLLTEQKRQVYRKFEEVEPCFHWQIEPTGPITYSNRSTPYPEIRHA